jgi:DNA-binding IclR family transcriptional regulator
MAGNAVDRGRSVTAKLFAILTSFSAGGYLNLSQLARCAGLPLSTAHRLAGELVAADFLRRCPDGGFRSGPAVQRLTQGTSGPPMLQERAPQVVEDVVDALHRPVRLGVLDELEVAYIEKAPGYAPVTSFSPAARLPAHATALGKALLAFASADIVRLITAARLPGYTVRTLVRPDQLLHAVQCIRRTGLAISHGELTVDTYAIAVPVLGPGNVAVAAIEVEIDEVTPDTIAAVTPALVLAGKGLSRELHPARYPRAAEPVNHHTRPPSVELTETVAG